MCPECGRPMSVCGGIEYDEMGIGTYYECCRPCDKARYDALPKCAQCGSALFDNGDGTSKCIQCEVERLHNSEAAKTFRMIAQHWRRNGRTKTYR